MVAWLSRLTGKCKYSAAFLTGANFTGNSRRVIIVLGLMHAKNTLLQCLENKTVSITNCTTRNPCNIQNSEPSHSPPVLSCVQWRLQWAATAGPLCLSLGLLRLGPPHLRFTYRDKIDIIILYTVRWICTVSCTHVAYTAAWVVFISKHCFVAFCGSSPENVFESHGHKSTN